MSISVRSSGASRVGQSRVAIIVGVVPFAILALGASAFGSHGDAGSLAGPIDTFDPLDATSLAGGHMTGTSGLAAMAAQAGLADATAWQGAGHCGRVGFIIGTGKPETLAVRADVAGTVAADLAGATCGAGQGRLLGLAVGRIGVRGRLGDGRLAIVSSRSDRCW